MFFAPSPNFPTQDSLVCFFTVKSVFFLNFKKLVQNEWEKAVHHEWGGKESRKMTKVFRIKKLRRTWCRCSAECMNYEWGDWRVCNFFQWFFFVANLMQIRIGIRRKRRDEPSPAKRCFTSCCPPLLPPKCTVKGAEAQTPNCFLVRGSSIHTSYTFHLLPDHIYSAISWQMMRQIGTLMIVSWSHVCSLCKGLGRCKVFWVKMVKTLRAQFPSQFHQPTTCFSKSGRHHMSTVEMRGERDSNKSGPTLMFAYSHPFNF